PTLTFPAPARQLKGLGQLRAGGWTSANPVCRRAFRTDRGLHMQSGMNRRHFLAHLAGASALALPGLQFWNGLRAAESKLKKENKSLIILWMGGGPSHMDLWDLKPGEPTGGEFKPVKTSAPGIQISEILAPTLAPQFKYLSVIRSLVTNEGSH